MSVYLTTEYVAVTCGPESSGGCNLSFAMTRTFYRQTKATGQTWYCPNGHPRIWTGDTTEEKLRKAQTRETSLRDQLEASAREVEATKAVLLRDRQRFANGVCPCCNRSFENVARHMRSQHPDYDVTKVERSARPDFGCSCGRSFESLRGLHQHQTKQRVPGWYRTGTSRRFAHLTVV